MSLNTLKDMSFNIIVLSKTIAIYGSASLKTGTTSFLFRCKTQMHLLCGSEIIGSFSPFNFTQF